MAAATTLSSGGTCHGAIIHQATSTGELHTCPVAVNENNQRTQQLVPYEVYKELRKSVREDGAGTHTITDIHRLS